MLSPARFIYWKIKRYDTIAIFRHIQPDMDALGSQHGLAEWIRANFPKKKVYCLGADHQKYTGKKFIPASDSFDGEGKFLAICVDVSNHDRIDAVDIFEKADFKIGIDHHPSFDEDYFDFLYDDSDKMACAQIVAELLFSLHKKMPKQACKFLFAGIDSDSGHFRYNETDSSTFLTASKLIKKGQLRVWEDIHMIIGMTKYSEALVTSKIIEKLDIDENGFAFCINTKKELEEWGITPSSANERVNLINKIDEVNIVLSLSEVDEGLYKGSIRSKTAVINKIAMRYNGGGHDFAAGVKNLTYERGMALKEELKSLLK